jgi:hypothetical protein
MYGALKGTAQQQKWEIPDATVKKLFKIKKLISRGFMLNP